MIQLVYIPQNDEARRALDAVLAVAYRTSWSAGEYAQRLSEMCMLREGDMDEILGRDS